LKRAHPVNVNKQMTVKKNSFHIRAMFINNPLWSYQTASFNK
jgi:hypothetical protein